MIELSEPNGAVRMSAADSETRWDDANKRALHFMFGVQRVILEEMAFAAYATIDRVRTETHLLGEFASKLGAAHSVQDWKAMGQRMRSAPARIHPARIRSGVQAWGAIDRGDLKPVEQSAIAPSSDPEDSMEVRRLTGGALASASTPIRPAPTPTMAPPTGATPSSRGRYASCRAR